MEENLKLFETVHESISNIINCQKRGISEEKIVEFLISTMKCSHDFVSDEEKLASGCAVLVASKLLISGIQNQQQTNQLIELFSVSIDLIESSKKKSSLKWIGIQSIFMKMVPSIPNETPTALKFIDFFQKMINFISKSQALKTDFYKLTNLVILSKTISTFLEILTDQKRDIELRKKSLKVLLTIVSKCEMSQIITISTIIPGILSKLCTILVNNSTESLDILENSLNLFEKCLAQCFSDLSFEKNETKIDYEIPKEIQKLIISRNDQVWKNNAAENIQKYISAVCSSLINHRDLKLKEKLVELLINAQKNCDKFFEEKLFATIVDTYLLLSQDQDFSRTNLIEQLPKLINSKNRIFIEKRLFEKLDELSICLPKLARAGKSENSMKMLCAVIHGLKNSLEVLCTSKSSVILALVRSISDCIKIETEKLMISKTEIASNLKEQIRRIPLKFNVRHENLEMICEQLAESCGYELLDVFYTEMIQSSKAQKSSYSILIAYSIFNLSQNLNRNSDESLIQLIAEYFIQISNQLFDKRLKNDEIIEDQSYTENIDNCLESLICINLSLLVIIIQKENKKSKLLIDILYILLLECSSTSWTIVESAEFSLNYIAKCSNLNDTSELISKYGTYIVHQISLTTQSIIDHSFGSLVFHSFLDRCQNSSFFENSCQIVKKLLDALDRFEQTHTICILQALKSFVSAVNRWFPELKPIEEKSKMCEVENETKQIPTAQMLIVENILKRAKNMVKSPCFPIKILTFDIIDEGLECLKNFDDLLLPMIHQNWQSLIEIMIQDENPIILICVLRIAKTMSKISAEFVQQRILNQLWPILRKNAIKELKNNCLYTQTSNFKLLQQILMSFPEICIDTKMAKDQIESTEILKYLEAGKNHGNVEIRDICLKKTEILNEYLTRL